MKKYITERNILHHPPYYNNKDNKIFLPCCLAQSEKANKDGFSQRNNLRPGNSKVAFLCKWDRSCSWSRRPKIIQNLQQSDEMRKLLPARNQGLNFDEIGHRPPESSIASWLYTESSPQSNLCCILSYSCLRVTSTCCHSSHRSAKPSPSNIRTTSDMVGRSSGEGWVQSNAT